MSIADTQRQTARSTRGTVPVSRLLLNGSAFDVTVVDASLVFVDGQHDEVKITVTSSTLTTTDGLVDSLISFLWGVAPRTETFSGYIMNAESQSGGSTGSLTFVMTIFGATKAMFQGSPQFWSNKSAPTAVSELASKNMLGFYGHPHTYLWRALAQTNETDWAMVNALTTRLGWRLWSRYGCLMCFSPLKLFTESGSYCRLFMGAPEDYTTDRQLLDFTPTEQSSTEKSLLGSKYGYFSDQTVQVATQAGDFKGYRFTTDTVVDGPVAAAAYLDSQTTDFDTWKQSAMARVVWGDADIYPGMCVDVVTTNRRYVKAQFDGKWLVRAVSHQMDRQQYQTLYFLVRPSSQAAAGSQPYTPFWRVADSSAAKPYLSINGDQWQSSKSSPGRG